MFLRGLHYRNHLVYSFLTFLKLGRDYDLRYRIASRYINNGDSVLDVCAGTGRLVLFLPPGCLYTGIEASADFANMLAAKKLAYQKMDLHKELPCVSSRYDVILMIISLCHFRRTSLGILLETFKTIGKKVVIVEDVLLKRRDKNSFLQKAMDFLCGTDYYLPTELFTSDEFRGVMKKYGYRLLGQENRYVVACYGC